MVFYTDSVTVARHLGMTEDIASFAVVEHRTHITGTPLPETISLSIGIAYTAIDSPGNIAPNVHAVHAGHFAAGWPGVHFCWP